jgi:hypothetical protein
VALAFGGVSVLRDLATTAGRFDLGAAAEFPRLSEVAVDGSVLAFTAATGLITGILFGLAPALRLSRADAGEHPCEETGATVSGYSRPSLRTVLLVADVAAALVLPVGGTLLIRTFANLMNVDPGYSASNVLTFQVSLPLVRYPDDRLKTFAEGLVEQLRAIPGIQIVQAPGYVVLANEMNHNARIVPLDDRPYRPMRRWVGESRGQWEGKTLVVETRNFLRETSFDNGRTSPSLRLIERFTRADADTLIYEFTVDDPTVYTKPWTAQVTMTRNDQLMYEYACHEGNVGLVNILTGARAKEKENVAARNR